MVNVICKDGKFLVKGTFSFGMAGNFENTEYGEGNIQIQHTVEDYAKDLEQGGFYWGSLRPLFETMSKDEESMAKVLEDYINGQEEKIQKNVKQINDYFLYHLVLDFVDVETPFWETSNAILPEYRDRFTEDDYEEVYSKENCERISALYKDFNHTPNDGSMEKADVEKLAKEVFPMFDFDGLIASVHPELLVFSGRWMSVQFSDGWAQSFYCRAFDEFDENLMPTDWHNF